MTLTKANIIENIAEQNGFPKNRSSEIIETLLEIVKHALESGEDLLISGFGKFKVNEKKERRGRNPETRESMLLAPRRVVTFHWSRKLREKINRN
jgi:integration host factor subunit alpha